MDTDDKNILRSVLKFVTKETEHICRFCFTSTETDAVFLDDYVVLQTKYLDETITFQDMLDTLNVPFEDDLPLTLCNKCAESIRISYLFSKMYDYSNRKWIESLENIKNTVELSDNYSSKAKTVYIVSTDDNKLVFFQQKQVVKNKKIILAKVKSLINKRCRTIIKRNFNNEIPSDFFHIDDVISLEKYKKKNAIKQVDTDIVYSCPKCFKIFKSKSNFNKHFDRVHSKKKIMCSKCPEMFSTIRLIQQHELTHHEPIECKKCSITFPSRKQLWNHVKKHGPMECSHCHKVFKHQTSYKIHVKLCGEDHDSRSKLVCDICNKEYLHMQGIKNHMMIAHGFGKPCATCPWCNKKFAAKSYLENHIVVHTRQRDFICKICGGEFVTSHALKYHIRLHTGEKPVTCDICGESFVNSSRKMDHVRRHHLHKTKQCPICHKEYKETSLSRHIKRHKDPNSSIFIEKDNNYTVE